MPTLFPSGLLLLLLAAWGSSGTSFCVVARLGQVRGISVCFCPYFGVEWHRENTPNSLATYVSRAPLGSNTRPSDQGPAALPTELTRAL